MSTASIPEIIDELKAGRMVILVDEEDRENEGDLVLLADFVTPEAINFMAKHGRGLICLTLTEERCRQLNLTPMTASNGARTGTNFTVSIEAAEGVTTGISAADRARTIQVAVAASSGPGDIVQPGHIFPIRARDGGVLIRAGHTEAGCDLGTMAGHTPAAVICEIMKDDGTMARLPDLIEFAAIHKLKIGTIADLIQYRSANESLIERVAERIVSTAQGEFRLVAYRDKPHRSPHIALVRGEPQHDAETLVRVHEPVTVLDFLHDGGGSHSWPISRALEAIAASPAGVLVLLNCAQPGERLFAQIDELTRIEDDDAMRDEVRRAGKVDLRTYGIGAQILKDLGVGRMRLLAQPRKMPSMTGFDLEVAGFEPGTKEQKP
jgi:3,4-dihydroxy 2-butanone 4-phosphate synthase/GTP cyclohydrolase II